MNIRRFLHNFLATIFNYGVAWIFKPLCFTENDKVPYIAYDVPIVNDPLKFVETLLKVHGYQIFVNGAFNGDPHPGDLQVFIYFYIHLVSVKREHLTATTSR